MKNKLATAIMEETGKILLGKKEGIKLKMLLALYRAVSLFAAA